LRLMRRSSDEHDAVLVQCGLLEPEGEPGSNDYDYGPEVASIDRQPEIYEENTTDTENARIVKTDSDDSETMHHRKTRTRVNQGVPVQVPRKILSRIWSVYVVRTSDRMRHSWCSW
jgi:hypothetical protein